MKRKRTRFHKGQVVMVVKPDGSGKYPVLLDHVSGIGNIVDGRAWQDSCHNTEYEITMRPLTARERGPEVRRG